jgi:hypothetical protein
MVPVPAARAAYNHGYTRPATGHTHLTPSASTPSVSTPSATARSASA